MVEPTEMRSLSLNRVLLMAMFMSLVLPDVCSVSPLLISTSTIFPILEFAIAALIRLLMMLFRAYPLFCAASLLSPIYIPVASNAAAKPSRVSSSKEASSRVMVSSSGASRKKPMALRPIESSTPSTRTPVLKVTRRVSSSVDCTSAFTCCEAEMCSIVWPKGPLKAT